MFMPQILIFFRLQMLQRIIGRVQGRVERGQDCTEVKLSTDCSIVEKEGSYFNQQLTLYSSK